MNTSRMFAVAWRKPDDMAVAPEMYARQGDVSGMEDIQKIISEVVSEVPDTQVMSDGGFRGRMGRARMAGIPQKLAVQAFAGEDASSGCMRHTATSLKAGVAWYGRLITPSVTRWLPPNPIDVAAKLKAPVSGSMAEKIRHSYRDRRQDEGAALKSAGGEIGISPSIPKRPTDSTRINKGQLPRSRCEGCVAAHADLVQEARCAVVI